MINDITTEITAAIEHLKTEYDAVRTGRANPALVETINVEAYGSIMPIVQLASINVPEPRLLVIQPWDAAVIKDIERAISQSNIGISPVVDGKVIRLPFPAMTEDRRKEMVKLISEKAEECRVRIRSGREEIMKMIKRKETDGELSEDMAKIERDQVQKHIEQSNLTIEQLIEKKTKELMTV
jgi:ribosome recycling factor